MNAAELLVRCLENEGVRYVFGIREFTNIKTVWIGPAQAAKPTPSSE